jgi:thiamine biosynthesis protein ThiI
MDNRPWGEEDEILKVNELAKRLLELFPGKVRLFRAPHGLSLSSFRENCNEKYTCILCKKAMLNLADMMCHRWDAQGIIMGDSLGQVASQTLPNLAAVSAGIGHHIIRPLIGMDKVDIEKVAKDIKTFEISIRRTTGCTATPRHPITNAKPDLLDEEAGRGHLHRIKDDVASRIVEVHLR